MNDENQEQRAEKAALRSPLLMHLRNGKHRERISFALPGNNNGLLYPEFLKRDYLAFDLTELPVTEDLNDPGAALQAAEANAAACYGAADAIFVTLGSSVAIKAVIGGACGRQGTLLTALDVHKSALQAAELLDLGLLFLNLDVIENPEKLHDLLQKYPEVRAVYLTTPDFYGHCYDISKIARVLEKTKVLLIVDSAHGAHFPFGKELMPAGAIEQGADLVVCSAHKTLPAPTPTSIILIGKKLQEKRPDLDSRKIRKIAATFTSTSPPLMLGVGLDYAISYMDLYGYSATSELLQLVDKFISQLPAGLKRVEIGISSDSKDLPANRKSTTRPLHDPLRIVIDCADVCPGPVIVKDLMANKINPEMADLCRFVLIPHFGQTWSDFSRTLEVLNKLCAKYRQTSWPENLQTENLRRLDRHYRHRLTVPAFSTKPYHPAACLNLAWHLDTKWVEIDQACNRHVAEALIPYPPGIPLLWPGDTLKLEDIELFKSLFGHSLNVHGTQIKDNKIYVPILASAADDFESTLEY